jgi:hypothetical protein
MRHMPNFTPVRLPSAPKDADYRKVIGAFRQWAGPHVYLGEAGKFVAGKEGELLLHELAVDHIIALHMTVREMYGSTLSYTAKAPDGAIPSSAGFVEVIKVHMRVDPGSVIWITGLSAEKENPSGRLEWLFQLTPQARELAIASFLESNGVDPGVDVRALVNAVEAEGDRLAALAGP